MSDFPRIEVSGDKDGGWLAEIHDGVFHHVFGDLTGANENEVRDAAVAKFAEAHPETKLGKEAARVAAEKARVEAEAKAEEQKRYQAAQAEAQEKLRAAQAERDAAAQSPGEQRAAEIIAGNEAQAAHEREMQAAHEPEPMGNDDGKNDG